MNAVSKNQVFIQTGATEGVNEAYSNTCVLPNVIDDIYFRINK